MRIVYVFRYVRFLALTVVLSTDEKAFLLTSVTDIILRTLLLRTARVLLSVPIRQGVADRPTLLASS